MKMWTTDLLSATDYALCSRIHRLSQRKLVCSLFRLVSRLGDGVIWYAVIFVLPMVYGGDGLKVSLLLAVTALSGVAIYKLIKGRFRRLRPFHRHADIEAAALALDEFSFPSGHTLHAVGFTVVLAMTLPWLALVFLPFAILTALSRVILGLHYPSDVAAGALVGALISGIVVKLGWLAGLLPL